MESITDGFFEVDKNWTVTYWNKAAEEILNKPKNEILGKTLWEEYHDAISLKLYEEYYKAKETGTPSKFEDYYPTRDKWFEIAAYPGKKNLSVFFKDITLNKKQALKLQQAKKNEDAMINSTRDLIWSVDKDMRLISGNQPFYDFITRKYGKNLEEGDPVILPELEWERKEKWKGFYNRALAGEQFSETVDLVDQGETTHVLISFNPILDNNLNCSGAACFLKDISERIQHIQAIESQNERLREIAWTHSHSFRGPLSRLMGLINLLKMEDQSDISYSELLQYITDATHELDEITRVIVRKSEEIENFK